MTDLVSSVRITGRSLLRAAAAAVACAVLMAAGAARAADPDPFAAMLKNALDATKAPAAAPDALEGEPQLLQEFYDKLQFKPIWFDENGPTERAKIFVERLRRAAEHGLEPEDYDHNRLAKAVERFEPAKRAVLEVAMSRAFMRYATDINAGRISPARALPDIYMRPVRPDPERLLVAAGEVKNFAKFIDELPPRTPQYKRLVGALADYRKIANAGGWKPVTPGPTLKPGMRDPRVVQIRARLKVTGDLRASDADPTRYTPALAAAVKRFQWRHGLEEDGNAGKGTIEAMNVPVATRIDQIEINLERRRWMPDDLGDEYIFVNIADQHLKVVINANTDKPKTIHTARTVVGQRYHQTPIFSGVMSFVRFNPHWNVPQSIARKEMLPKLKKDPDYLNRNNYLLLTSPLDNATAINPMAIDWTALTPVNFPYFIRQKPGPWNALGTMIFMFPNPHNVFIHDTTARGLFARTVRYFSHGCIRVQYPAELAKVVLKPNGKWDDKRIGEIVETREEKQFALVRKLPVHITYLTAWSNKDGSHHFRDDVYGRDALLTKALRKAAVAARQPGAGVRELSAEGPGRSG